MHIDGKMHARNARSVAVRVSSLPRINGPVRDLLSSLI